MDALTAAYESVADFFLDDPFLRLTQTGVLLTFALLLFLLFWTLRDIIQRTRSFAYQFGCVLLVAALPVVGFLLYLLIRPARTVQQRETDALLRRWMEERQSGDAEPAADVPFEPPQDDEEEQADADDDSSPDDQ